MMFNLIDNNTTAQPLNNNTTNSNNGSDHENSINSFIDKIQDKFATNQLVSDLIIYHNSKLLTSREPHQQYTIEPSLSDALFRDDGEMMNNQQTSIQFNMTKFIITQRPSSNMIIATTVHQREALLLSQIYSNCFLVLRFERRKGIMMIKTIQDAICYIEKCIEL